VIAPSGNNTLLCTLYISFAREPIETPRYPALLPDFGIVDIATVLISRSYLFDVTWLAHVLSEVEFSRNAHADKNKERFTQYVGQVLIRNVAERHDAG
jgi:hypothetical protein